LISIEENEDLEDEIKFERRLKTSFKYITELLNRVTIIYKLNKRLKELLDLELKKVANVTNNKMFLKILENFETNLNQFENKFSKEMEEIKNIYSKNVKILKEIEISSIFDSVYGIYNETYFIRQLEKELKIIKKFHHRSSVIVVKIKDSILKKFSSEKLKILTNRSLAKIMLKTSRRTDIVAKIEDNIFGMFLKHTDIIGAEKTIERLADTISNSSIFIGDEELELKIVAGVVELNENGDVKTYLSKLIEALNEAEKNNQLYEIAKV
jgi:GGDEF domain-containing protein